MDYVTNQQLYNYFKSEIETLGQKEIEKLRAEMKDLKEERLKKITASLREKYEKKERYRLRELNTDHSTQINKINQKNHRLLMEKRQNLLEKIFTAVEDRLYDYVKTDDYLGFMTEKIKKLNEMFGEEAVEFYIGDDDKKLHDAIKEFFPSNDGIHKTSDINIGGYIAECEAKGLRADETLDTCMSDNRDWFYANADLFIRE